MSDAAITKGRTVRVDDVDLYVEERGAGPALLLLHGFTGAGADWGHLFDLDALARSFRVIVPDLRGHGRSSNPSVYVSHRDCARDVLGLVDQLGVTTFSAVGLSMGGNVMLHVSSRAPSRVDAQVLVSATPYFPAAARAVMRKIAATPQTSEERAVMRSRHHLGDAQIDALFRQMGDFADSHDDLSFTPPLLARITARTLLCAGDRDPLYPIEETTFELYRSIPDAYLFTIPSGGHVPVFGEWKETWVRAALGFLRAPSP